MAAEPKFEGPLRNPDWTDQQDSDFEKNDRRNSTGLAREDALGLPVGSTHDIHPETTFGKGEDGPSKVKQRPGGRKTRPVRSAYGQHAAGVQPEEVARQQQGGSPGEPDILIGSEPARRMLSEIEERERKRLLERNGIDPPES